MAPLFSAFDHGTYQRILTDHLANLKNYPPQILHSLQSGGFTISISKKKWHSVAFDEAHEMCINKDLKLAISRPTKSYIQKTSLFFNYHIKAYKSLIINQLFPETSKDSTTPSITMLDNTPQFARIEENIQVMCTEINEKNLFPLYISTNRGVINVFTVSNYRAGT